MFNAKNWKEFAGEASFANKKNPCVKVLNHPVCRDYFLP